MTPPSAQERLCVLLAVRADGGERTPLFSLTPIERTALAFARAGVRRFALAGDPEAVRAAEAALRGGPCASLRIRSVPHLSTAAGDEPFFLARGDCHYDRQLVARFVAENAGAVDSVVAIDFRAEAKPRAADLPQVAVWNREDASARVQRVAKGLVGADGVLVGLVAPLLLWPLRGLREMPPSSSGELPVSGSEQLPSPTTTTTYGLRCENGSQQTVATVTVTPPEMLPPFQTKLFVAVNVALPLRVPALISNCWAVVLPWTVTVPPFKRPAPRPVKVAPVFSVNVPPLNSTAVPVTVVNSPDAEPPAEKRTAPVCALTIPVLLNGIPEMVWPAPPVLVKVPLLLNAEAAPPLKLIV